MVLTIANSHGHYIHSMSNIYPEIPHSLDSETERWQILIDAKYLVDATHDRPGTPFGDWSVEQTGDRGAYFKRGDRPTAPSLSIVPMQGGYVIATQFREYEQDDQGNRSGDFSLKNQVSMITPDAMVSTVSVQSYYYDDKPKSVPYLGSEPEGEAFVRHFVEVVKGAEGTDASVRKIKPGGRNILSNFFRRKAYEQGDESDAS